MGSCSSGFCFPAFWPFTFPFARGCAFPATLPPVFRSWLSAAASVGLAGVGGGSTGTASYCVFESGFAAGVRWRLTISIPIVTPTITTIPRIVDLDFMLLSFSEFNPLRLTFKADSRRPVHHQALALEQRLQPQTLTLKRLPLWPSPPTLLAPVMPKPKAESKSRPKQRILLVEDEPDIRELYSHS